MTSVISSIGFILVVVGGICWVSLGFYYGVKYPLKGKLIHFTEFVRIRRQFVVVAFAAGLFFVIGALPSVLQNTGYTRDDWIDIIGTSLCILVSFPLFAFIVVSMILRAWGVKGK